MWVVNLKSGFGLLLFIERESAILLLISIEDESVIMTVVSVCARIELDKSQLEMKRMMWNFKILKW